MHTAMGRRLALAWATAPLTATLIIAAAVCGTPRDAAAQTVGASTAGAPLTAGAAPSAPRTSTPAAAPPLDFGIDAGRESNRFVRSAAGAAHLVVRAGERPRLIVAFPAGDSGIGVWFAPLPEPVRWRVPATLHPVQAGDWRDSPDGLDGGRYPYDVNAALVPAALALDAAGHPLPIMHSDESLRLLLGQPAPDELGRALDVLLRPFPAGLERQLARQDLPAAPQLTQAQLTQSRAAHCRVYTGCGG